MQSTLVTSLHTLLLETGSPAYMRIRLVQPLDLEIKTNTSSLITEMLHAPPGDKPPGSLSPILLSWSNHILVREPNSENCLDVIFVGPL